jgi:chromate transporter
MQPSVGAGSAGEVFLAAAKLGLTSFGGPIAHLGYFERTYVQKRRWLTLEQYGSLVSLCQLLPGPTSSQVGFLIGLQRAGWSGAAAAWAGFTLPSALLMYAFAVLAPVFSGPAMQSVLHGLMLTAVVIVAQAVWSMSRTLTPDLPRRGIAVAAFIVLVFVHSAPSQIATLAIAALAGLILCRSGASAALPSIRTDTRSGWISLSIFCLLLAGVPWAASYVDHGSIALAAQFYRAGALVFGGGHVVLPLLQQSLVPADWISQDRFLAGYGLAQAMPGPLFTFAAYLGAACAPAGRTAVWAVLSLLAVFLPGLLLAIAGASLLGRVANNAVVGSCLRGVNAAVVGLLAAALYDPVWKSAVMSLADGAIVVAAFILLQRVAAPPILIAGLCVAASLAQLALGH